MSRFCLEFNLNNAAFSNEPGREIARILRELANQYEESAFLTMNIRDINGNTIGESKVEDS